MRSQSSFGFLRGVHALCAAFLVILAVAGCGGGEAPQTAADSALSTLRAKGKALAAAGAPTQQMADQLFDLGESAYPGFFSSHEATQVYSGFYFRYYPGTGVYLGVVFDASYGYELNGVYAMGGTFGNAPFYAGPLSQYLPASASVPQMLVGASPFTIVYAATNFGIDGRSGPATFAANQTLSSYTFNANEAPQIGTLSVFEASGSQTVQIGRWANGTFAGKFYSAVDDTHSLTLTPDQGFHYAIATIPATLPCSGNKSYALTAATRPTLGDGSATSGAVDNLTATVTFNGTAAPTVSVTGAVTVDGLQRTFSGSQAAINANWKLFYLSQVASQTAGINTASIFGTFGGADSAQLGLVVAGLGVTSGSFTKGVNFAARLTQTASTSVACS